MIFLEKWHLFGNTFKQSAKGIFEAVLSTADDINYDVKNIFEEWKYLLSSRLNIFSSSILSFSPSYEITPNTPVMPQVCGRNKKLAKHIESG